TDYDAARRDVPATGRHSPDRVLRGGIAMTMRRPLLASVLSFLLVGGLLWCDSAAVVTTVKSTKTILVKGTVNTNTEPVPFSGNIQIKTTFVPDPDFGLHPIVIVSIDM